jgi:hypothetical protein
MYYTKASVGLGNRSALECYILELVKKIITVSLKTIKVVEGLPSDFGGFNVQA